MNLSRPLCSLDFEATGIDATVDRIIQAGFTVLYPDGRRTRWETLIDPQRHIPEESTVIHGITDEMVRDAPVFAQVASRIYRGLLGKDLCGFNLRSLDLPILDEELRRCGLKLDLDGVLVIDAFSIFQKKEPRDLSAAVVKYCGRSHEDAHGAGADAEATLDVLTGQLAMYEDLGEMDLAALAVYSQRNENPPVDLAGKLYRDADGDLRYTLAKVRDVKVRDDAGFAYWMLRQFSPPFPGSTCDALRAELERCGL